MTRSCSLVWESKDFDSPWSCPPQARPRPWYCVRCSQCCTQCRPQGPRWREASGPWSLLPRSQLWTLTPQWNSYQQLKCCFADVMSCSTNNFQFCDFHLSCLHSDCSKSHSCFPVCVWTCLLHPPNNHWRTQTRPVLAWGRVPAPRCPPGEDWGQPGTTALAISGKCLRGTISKSNSKLEVTSWNVWGKR